MLRCFGIPTLLAVVTLAGSIAFGEGGTSQPAPAATASTAVQSPHLSGPDGWRYRWHDNRWMYWLPEGRWVFWNQDRWSEFDRSASYASAYTTYFESSAPSVYVQPCPVCCDYDTDSDNDFVDEDIKGELPYAG